MYSFLPLPSPVGIGAPIVIALVVLAFASVTFFILDRRRPTVYWPLICYVAAFALAVFTVYYVETHTPENTPVFARCYKDVVIEHQLHKECTVAEDDPVFILAIPGMVYPDPVVVYHNLK